MHFILGRVHIWGHDPVHPALVKKNRVEKRAEGSGFKTGHNLDMEACAPGQDGAIADKADQAQPRQRIAQRLGVFHAADVGGQGFLVLLAVVEPLFHIPAPSAYLGQGLLWGQASLFANRPI